MTDNNDLYLGDVTTLKIMGNKDLGAAAIKHYLDSFNLSKLQDINEYFESRVKVH